MLSASKLYFNQGWLWSVWLHDVCLQISLQYLASEARPWKLSGTWSMIVFDNWKNNEVKSEDYRGKYKGQVGEDVDGAADDWGWGGGGKHEATTEDDDLKSG